jgi:hypothetical protein
MENPSKAGALKTRSTRRQALLQVLLVGLLCCSVIRADGPLATGSPQQQQLQQRELQHHQQQQRELQQQQASLHAVHSRRRLQKQYVDPADQSTVMTYSLPKIYYRMSLSQDVDLVDFQDALDRETRLHLYEWLMDQRKLGLQALPSGSFKQVSLTSRLLRTLVNTDNATATASNASSIVQAGYSGQATFVFPPNTTIVYQANDTKGLPAYWWDVVALSFQEATWFQRLIARFLLSPDLQTVSSIQVSVEDQGVVTDVPIQATILNDIQDLPALQETSQDTQENDQRKLKVAASLAVAVCLMSILLLVYYRIVVTRKRREAKVHHAGPMDANIIISTIDKAGHIDANKADTNNKPDSNNTTKSQRRPMPRPATRQSRVNSLNCIAEDDDESSAYSSKCEGSVRSTKTLSSLRLPPFNKPPPSEALHRDDYDIAIDDIDDEEKQSDMYYL